MATTSPDNLRTPNPGDPYNLVADLATLASDTQVALNKKVSNLLTGTAAQRVAATSTSTNGMLWQDTDGIRMIWRKDGSVWVPAVWRWAGTTAQRDGFTQAPVGFEWYNSTTASTNYRIASGWVSDLVEAQAGAAGGAVYASGWANVVNVNWNGLWSSKTYRTVTVNGAATKGSFASLETICTLPAEMRPSQNKFGSAVYGATAGYVLITAAGEVKTVQSGSGQVSIGATFPV